MERELLLEGIFQHYGWDFRDYAPASLKRRVWKCVKDEKLSTISGLQERILHDSACMERFLLTLSVSVTGMFRDPKFFLYLRKKIIPILKKTSFIRIWNVGCSTGEEVYSLAILLKEEELYDHTKIYATDINEAILQKAKEGICRSLRASTPAASFPRKSPPRTRFRSS